MNKMKDKTMKEFLENNAYFVDFFNAYFFDGEKVLEAMNCEELDSEMNDANIGTTSRKRTHKIDKF